MLKALLVPDRYFFSSSILSTVYVCSMESCEWQGSHPSPSEAVQQHIYAVGCDLKPTLPAGIAHCAYYVLDNYFSDGLVGRPIQEDIAIC